MAAALAAVFNGAALADRLASNGSTVLALRQNGTLVGWGDNAAGLFGNNSAELPSSSYPISLSHLPNLKSVSLGGRHALGLRPDGTVVAWGINESGQLGQGSVGNNVSVSPPVPVAGLNNVIAIATGASHSLALRQGGTVWAWGSNQAGQLGDGSFNSYTQPHQIMTLSGVTAIAASGSLNAALLGDGSVWFWGQANTSYGSVKPYLPTAIPKLGNIVAIAVAANRIISLGADGSVYEWTPPSYSYPNTLNSALKVNGIPPATQIAVDNLSIYSLSRGDGKIWQSSYNSSGSSNKPAALSNAANVVEIATGLNVALTKNGDLYRWDLINSNNYYSTPTYTEPRLVRGLGNEGSLNLNTTSPAPAEERCQATAAQSGASVNVNVPCVRFNGYNYQMSLQFDPSVTVNNGSYFKLLELK